MNFRCHVIDKFNSGLFSIVIASDDKNVDGVNNQEEEKEKGKKAKVGLKNPLSIFGN